MGRNDDIKAIIAVAVIFLAAILFFLVLARLEIASDSKQQECKSKGGSLIMDYREIFICIPVIQLEKND